jgi:hypothetical protein
MLSFSFIASASYDGEWLRRYIGTATLVAAVTFHSQAADADPPDALQIYARQCTDAIKVAVPDFDCDDPNATEVPGNTPTGTRDGLPTCDQPNRLNRECDPGSRFHVLVRSDSAFIVAHCRKKNASDGNGDGEYGDIAVIQHNTQNGATCFYQAGPAPRMSGKVSSPSNGLGLWSQNVTATSHWNSPSFTAGQGCGGCHDNGPLIRSPYLNQVEGPNAIPGKDDSTFNSEKQLYSFVGDDFASWEAFKVKIQGNHCNDCHRMGANNVTAGGTARVFGLRATAECSPASPQTCEREKNFHSPTSPIWMTPGQIIFNKQNELFAQAIHDCALRLGENPLPHDDSCSIAQFAGAFVAASPPPTSGVDLSAVYYLLLQ